MRSFKKTVACLVAVLMVLSACSAAFTASAVAATSGTCGNNATWVIENGTLTISGDGAMYDYNFDAPWGDGSGMRYYSNIVINPGITYIGSRAFYDSKATSVSIPNTVTVLGDGAFHWSGLTSVTIPGSITSWQNAFNLCLNLSYVTIENGVTAIDSACFGGCSNLSYVSLPDSLTSIGNGAFVGCTSLASIDLPFNLISIDDGAFQNTGLTTVSLPNSVNTVGVCAFSDSTLTSITLSPAMSVIQEGMFNNCSSLESVSIPASVTAIEQYAFNGCPSLDRVYYGGTQQQWDAITIGEGNHALDDARVVCSDTPAYLPYCGNNAMWSITNGVLSISGRGAMYDYGTTPYLVPDWAYQGFTGVVVGENITSIGAQAFQGITTITSLVTFPGLESIGDNAFCGCTGLTSTVFANNLRSIGDLAFSNCDGLTSFDIPSSVWSLGDYAFQQCDNLTTLTIGSGVTELGYGTLQECPALTTINYNAVNAMDLASNNYLFAGVPNANTPVTVNIGSDVWYIPANLFRLGAPGYGPAITTVNIPVGLSAIGAGAFKNCTTIADVYYSGTKQQWNALNIGADNDPLTNAAIHCSDGTILPADACGEHARWSIENGVLTITGQGDMYDFYNPYVDGALTPPWKDEYYTEVVIGYGVTSIGNDAFVNNADLTTVTIPDTVTSIGDEAFTLCESLLSVNIPNSVETIGERAFLQCTNLSTLTLGSGLTEIKIGAFGACSSLSSVVIPDSVEIIGVSAFDGCCGLTSLTIGSGVTSIGATAFACCEALTEINYNVPNLADLTNEHGVFAFGSPVNTPVTVTFGDNVQHVPAYLFDRYEPDYGPQITTVYFGNALTSVGHDAFYNCTTITDVNYGGTQQQWNAITIGSNNDPLQNATKNFVVSGTCYENLTWAYDPYTRTLTISGTGEIKESPWASYGSSMKTLVVNSGVTGICDYAFSGCTGLTNVTLPDSVASIGDHAFNDTAYYKDQSNWQNGVLYINNHVIKANQFHANGAYVIRPGTKTIAYSAFYGCSGLTSVTIPNSVTSICDNAFMACVGLTELTIPDGVTSIRRAAFSLCRGLTSVTIPDGVTSIGELAFSRCTGLTSVTIPDSVTSIDRGVFYYCGALADVYFDGTQQQWNGITISTDMNDPLFAATIHCSDGTIGEAPEDTYSVSVNDQVALNLMLDLEARGVTTDAVSVTLNGQPVEYDVVQDGDQYRFSIVTAPAQLADPILVTAGGETLAETSVMDYCLALCGPEYDEYPEAQALARALLQYGKAANDVFDYTDDEITTFGTLDTTPVHNYTGARFNDGTHKVTGASFMALAKPDFRFYMDALTEAEAYAYNQAGITAAYRDTSVEEELHARFLKKTVNGQTVILVEVTGISAENMNEEVVVNIPGLGTFTFNGNAFAKAMANDSDPATQNLGAALYNYGVAANACFRGEEQP